MRLVLLLALLGCGGLAGWRIWLAYNPVREDEEASYSRRLVVIAVNVLVYVAALAAVAFLVLITISAIRLAIG